MHSKKLKTLALLVAFCLIVFASCNKPPKEVFFGIPVDSIAIVGIMLDGFFYDLPPSNMVSVGDSVIINLYGTIGHNQCYVYYDNKSYTLDDNSTEVLVELYGTKIHNDGWCSI